MVSTLWTQVLENLILNLFYKKWILDFELNPNIWIWI